MELCRTYGAIECSGIIDDRVAPYPKLYPPFRVFIELTLIYWFNLLLIYFLNIFAQANLFFSGLFPIQPASPEVFPRFMNDDAREEEEGEEVRDCHEGVEDVGKIPDKV